MPLPLPPLLLGPAPGLWPVNVMAVEHAPSSSLLAKLKPANPTAISARLDPCSLHSATAKMEILVCITDTLKSLPTAHSLSAMLNFPPVVDLAQLRATHCITHSTSACRRRQQGSTANQVSPDTLHPHSPRRCPRPEYRHTRATAPATHDQNSSDSSLTSTPRQASCMRVRRDTHELEGAAPFAPDVVPRQPHKLEFPTPAQTFGDAHGALVAQPVPA